MRSFLFVFGMLVVGASTASGCSSGSDASSSSSSSSSSGDVADAGDLPPEGEDAATAGAQCSVARTQLLGPVAKVSQAEVKVVSENAGVKRIYVDASAGGQAGAAKNPRVYVDLTTGARVDVTDPGALTSSAWDLALKRTVIFTNSGDAGPGEGGGADARRAFEAVTAADGSKVSPEKFFDAECNPQTDQIGGPATTFAEWYDYDTAANGVTPRETAYVVRGASGKLFKVKIVSFTANPDGTMDRPSTGYFLLDVAAL